MKSIMIMFDSLNRNYLSSYGCDWTKLPNFNRLKEKTLTFNNFYAGSMPCMPARRELHTGRYNFLHRSWSPMEPFDESSITNLRDKGIYTHLISDHFHYWEDGGIGYHTKYNTWEIVRGQQGDLCIGQVADPEMPESLSSRSKSNLKWQKASWRQDWVNRSFQTTEDKMPQTQTFMKGIDFIDRNKDSDNWFLQIETFDPHEPFYTQQCYKDLYPHEYKGKHIDWPDYAYNALDRDATEHVKYEYAALLSMCDTYLGKVLDKMDEYNLWEDTMLIVNTDHGFMLGEKEWMGKNIQPMYNEIVHIPFFIYDPRTKKQNETRDALAQTVDLAPTLLEFFGAEPLVYADGKSLTPVINNDTPVREAALYGAFGATINVSDGKYTYLHTPATSSNSPLYEYTLMPTHMNSYFSVNELQNSELDSSFKFMKGCKVLKIPSSNHTNPYWYDNKLFDLTTDPEQLNPIDNLEIQRDMIEKMKKLMIANDAPDEAYVRYGIPKDREITLEEVQALNNKDFSLFIEGVPPLNKKSQKIIKILLHFQPTQESKDAFINNLSKALKEVTVDLITETLLEEIYLKNPKLNPNPFFFRLCKGFIS